MDEMLSFCPTVTTASAMETESLGKIYKLRVFKK